MEEDLGFFKRMSLAATALLTAFSLSFSSQALAQAAGKPNILVIFGDDIGVANVSAYSQGLVGYRTPNIDMLGASVPFVAKYLESYKEFPPSQRPASFHHRSGDGEAEAGLRAVGGSR